MARRPRVSRFQLRDSDRSGFTQKAISLIRDNGRLVAADEFDQPPPSRLSLGGEGDTGSGARTTADQFVVGSTTDAGVTVTTVQATVSIAPVIPDPAQREGNTIQVYMAIAGSLTAVTMGVNPQIVAGQERQVLSLECVGSSVTFIHGSGLSLMAGQRFRMDSGSRMTFQYNSANAAWTETSRTR